MLGKICKRSWKVRIAVGVDLRKPLFAIDTYCTKPQPPLGSDLIFIQSTCVHLNDSNTIRKQELISGWLTIIVSVGLTNIGDSGAELTWLTWLTCYYI